MSLRLKLTIPFASAAFGARAAGGLAVADLKFGDQEKINDAKRLAVAKNE